MPTAAASASSSCPSHSSSSGTAWRSYSNTSRAALFCRVLSHLRHRLGFSLHAIDDFAGDSHLAVRRRQRQHHLPLLGLRLLDRRLGHGHRIVGLEMMPFFSMVDRRKRMHLEVMEDLPDTHQELLKTQIPYASDVEKMGVYRMPVGEFAPNSAAWKSYMALWSEVQTRLGVR